MDARRGSDPDPGTGPTRCRGRHALATLGLAWVLRNPNVSAAIVGASRPEQIAENAKAADVTLDDALVKRVDEILGPVIERDPERIDVFAKRP